MDKDLLKFLHNDTELRRFQESEIESVFAAMKEAGWVVVRSTAMAFIAAPYDPPPSVGLLKQEEPKPE